MKTLSVVVSAYNEEQNLPVCLESVKDICDEIIVVDNSSTDKTRQVALKYTKNVFTRENNLMLNINKNFGIKKATSEWVMLLDADEHLTPELAAEIKKTLALDVHPAGYTMPRKNIIFGKWIEHTGWYPDRQLRLFKAKGSRFAEKHVHEMITVSGEVGELQEDLYHLNYSSVSQFLDKMIRVYTVSEAENMLASGYTVKMADAVIMPTKEFVKRFFAEEGYKDGSHGLVLSLLMAVYHFIVFVRMWEFSSYPDASNVLGEFSEGSREATRQVNYWWVKKANEREKNIAKKFSRKFLYKVSNLW